MWLVTGFQEDIVWNKVRWSCAEKLVDDTMSFRVLKSITSSLWCVCSSFKINQRSMRFTLCSASEDLILPRPRKAGLTTTNCRRGAISTSSRTALGPPGFCLIWSKQIFDVNVPNFKVMCTYFTEFLLERYPWPLVLWRRAYVSFFNMYQFYVRTTCVWKNMYVNLHNAYFVSYCLLTFQVRSIWP